MVTLDAESVKTALGEMPSTSGLADVADGGWKIDVSVADGTVTLWVQLEDDLADTPAEAGSDAKVPGLHVLTPVLSGEGGLSVDIAKQALAAAAGEPLVRVGWCPSPDGSGPVIAAVAGLALDDLDVSELHETLKEVAETATRLGMTLQA